MGHHHAPHVDGVEEQPGQGEYEVLEADDQRAQEYLEPEGDGVQKVIGHIIKGKVGAEEGVREHRHEQCVCGRNIEENLHSQGEESLPEVPLCDLKSGRRELITHCRVAEQSNYRGNGGDEVEEHDDIHVPKGVKEPVVSFVLNVDDDAGEDEEEDESQYTRDAEKNGGPHGTRNRDISALKGQGSEECSGNSRAVGGTASLRQRRRIVFQDHSFSFFVYGVVVSAATEIQIKDDD